MKKSVSVVITTIFTLFATSLFSQSLLWARAMGGNGNEAGQKIKVDQLGNVYTVGIFSDTISFNSGAFELVSAGNYDIFISKFDSAGTFLWAKRIGGTSGDFCSSLAIDTSGNLYFTGKFDGTVDFDPNTGTSILTSYGNVDIFIEKLDSNGNLLWVKQMGATGPQEGVSVVVDPSNNVCVTGGFAGSVDFDPNVGVSNLTSTGGIDIFVVKLNSLGNLIWAKKMAGASNERGRAIACDANGNIYTTGTLTSPSPCDFDPGVGVFNLTSNGADDVFISKLDSLGNFIWAKAFGSVQYDNSNNITVDTFGNVLITGDFYDVVDFDPGTSVYNLTSSGGTDIFILKLTNSGNFVWAKNIGGIAYEYSIGITTDQGSNIYLNGALPEGEPVDFDPNLGVYYLTSMGSDDIFILKIDVNGGFVWVKSFGGVGYDGAASIDIDMAGNIYTTGYFLQTANFNPSTDLYNLIAVQEQDAFIQKLSQTGPANCVPAQPTGIIGSNSVSPNSTQVFSVATVPNTTEYHWSLPLGWTGNSTSNTITVTVGDSSGTVSVVAQNSCGISTSSTILVSVCVAPAQPYITSGNTSVNPGDSETYSVAPVAGATSYTWTLPSGWSGSSTSNSITVVVGTTGGTITVSAVNSCGTGSSTTLIVNLAPPAVFDQDWVWAKSTGAEYDGRAMDIATDALGNAYITGTFGSSTITFGSIILNRVSTGSGTDVFIAKYDANGNALWAKNANILAYVPGSSISIATDLNNNVFISGAFNVASANFGGTQLTHLGSVGQHSIFIVKYDSDGNVLWAKDVDYSGSLWMYDLATDSQGNALITGSFGSGSPLTIGSTSLTPYSNTNPFVAKFDVLGNALWAKGGESATNFANWSYGVATDANDNVFITGEYVSNASNPLTFGTHTLPETNSSGRSMYIVKFDSSGNALWVKSSVSPSSSWSYAAVGFHVTTDVNGNAIVAGSFKSTTVNFGSTVLTNSNTTSNVADMFIVKYDSSGNEVWAKKAGGTGDDEGHKISSDTYGNTYVSGYFQSVSASFGSLTVTKDDSYSSFFFVVKYDDLGNEVWVKDVDNTNAYGGGLMPNGVSADDFGNVYVTGDAYDSDQYDTAVFGNHILIDGGVFIAKLGETQTPNAVENANDKEQNLAVFPNPSAGVFNIKINSKLKEASIKVYSVYGQVVFESDKVVSGIDLSSQPAGVYFIQLKSEGATINKRIVIQ